MLLSISFVFFILIQVVQLQVFCVWLDGCCFSYTGFTFWPILCPEEYGSYLHDFVKKQLSSEIDCAESIRILHTKKHEIFRILNKKTSKAV